MTPEERMETLQAAAAADCDDRDDDELLRLLRGKPRPVCLDVLEPCGCRAVVVVADTLALLAGKMGGDWARIRDAGRRDVAHVEAALRALGGEVEFVWSSDEILRRAAEYWRPLVLDIAEKLALGREDNQVLQGDLGPGRGRTECRAVHVPIMQCADVFFFQADICHMAMDQREVTLLARDYSEASGRRNKPIIMSYHMLPGLKKGQKISNDLSSAIFMGDNEVNKKINKAFCPPGIVEANPCLEYITHIILPWSGNFVVLRTEANGGNKTYNGIEELFEDYHSGALHPADVKANLKKAINEILQHVRDNLIPFKSNSDADVLLNSVKSTPSTADDLPSRMPAMTPEKRCSQIMGRKEADALTAAQIMYPLMQCADIFFLKVDIFQMGLDQRKVNMLAREYCEAIRRNNRPIILSHRMLPGIKENQEKMSKSDPSSAIFMEDSESQVNEKILQAFCPHKITEENPCLEYIEYIVLPKSGRFKLLCKETDGSDRTYSDIKEQKK